MKKIILFLFIVVIFIIVFLGGYAVGTSAISETEFVGVEAEPAPVNETKVETEQPTLKSLGTFKLTAYCPCARCCGKCDGITATGTKATAGRTISVDPSKIPYGTEVIINGHTYIAEDCGGAINGNRIDIYFDSHTEALKFGIQYANVYVKLR